MRASAKEACRKIQEDKTEGEERTYPWITASEWSVANGRFSITADLDEVLLAHGDGIYTLSLWGIVDDEDVLISEYSIFHGVTPPTFYLHRPNITTTLPRIGQFLAGDRFAGGEGHKAVKRVSRSP